MFDTHKTKMIGLSCGEETMTKTTSCFGRFVFFEIFVKNTAMFFLQKFYLTMPAVFYRDEDY